MPSSNEKSPQESSDVYLVATIRCALATTGVIIFTLDLLAHTRLPEVSYLVLILYITYSVLLYMVARWRRSILSGRVKPWLDVGWAVALMALSSEQSGLLFAFAFFSLLIAALQWGLRLRLRTALGSALLFACVGAILSFAHPEFELSRVFVGLTALVVLGYMTTAFGGWELTLKGRLAFMKDVTRLLNLSFAVHRAIAMFMERLGAFYKADACILVMSVHGACSHMYVASTTGNFRGESILNPSPKSWHAYHPSRRLSMQSYTLLHPAEQCLRPGRKYARGAVRRRIHCGSHRCPIVGASPCRQKLGSRFGF